MFVATEQKTVNDRVVTPNTATTLRFVLDHADMHLGLTQVLPQQYNTQVKSVTRPAQFDSLKISAFNQSTINIANTRLHTLDVSLGHSRMEEDLLKAERLIIRADSLSAVTLSGENIKKVQ